MVQIQLTDPFNRLSLIPTDQNTYRKFYSIESILDLCDNILINMKNNKNTAMVSLDLRAAIDTVNHKILINVLENYIGIHEKASNWIMSYLQNRQFQVHINGTSSEKMTITYSIPQGSILGPLLFICYSSTIQEIMPNNMSGYADNHSLTESFKPGNTTIKAKLETKVKMSENG